MARTKEQSGGCRNCRRRKVKCDEQHPACQRCKKGNRECEGYVRDHRFVDETTRTEKHARMDRKTPPSPTSHSPPPNAETISPSPIVCSPWTLNLSAFEDDVRISFLLTYFGAHNFIPWLKSHAKDPSVCAQTSIRALSAAYFEKIHVVHMAARQSSRLYGKALVTLNHELQDEKRSLSKSVLVSAISLELYEFISFDSASGWMTHAGGVGKLIELRGPVSFQKPAGRTMLEGNRVTIALECMVEKKRCFLEHSDWKIIPWASDPGCKTLNIALHDFLCDVPGLLEDEGALSCSDTSGIKRHEYLSRKILLSLEYLYEWRDTWEQKHPNSCTEILTSTPVDKALFPIVLQYSDLPCANAIAVYNAILLLLLGLGTRVIGPAFDSSIPALHLPLDLNYHPLHPPGSAPNARAVAIEICRSVEYHLVNDKCNVAAFFLLFPLRIAYLTFEPEAKEARWLSEVMISLADVSGFEISRSLTTRATVLR